MLSISTLILTDQQELLLLSHFASLTVLGFLIKDALPDYKKTDGLRNVELLYNSYAMHAL